MSFWDTSALMKLYVRERDSNDFVKLATESETRAIIAQLSIHETWCSLHRKELMRAIPPDTAELAYRKFQNHVENALLTVIPYGRAVALEFDQIVRLCYRSSPAVPIRTLDGLLLASAVVARTSEMISTDRRVRAAGRLLGLHILPN